MPLTRSGILKLDSCRRLESLPSSAGDLEIKELNLIDCGIIELPSIIFLLTHLQQLRLKSCTSLLSIPSSISNLTSLRRLYISKCGNLKNLPEFSIMEFLEELDVSESGLKELPLSIQHFKKVKKLNCSGCGGLEMPQFICSGLSYINQNHCDLLKFPEQLCSLKSMTKIELRGNNFKSIPASIKHLSDLYELDLTNCRHLKFLPDIPLGLYVLHAMNCISLETLSTPFTFLGYSLGLLN